VLGDLDGHPILTSETCAPRHDRRQVCPADVEPGEIVVFDDQGRAQPQAVPAPNRPRPCIFEYIYFSRPDSIVGGPFGL